MSQFDDIFRQMQKDSSRTRRNRSSQRLFSFALLGMALLLTIPVFVIVYRYVPDIKLNIWQVIRVDHVLTFLLIFLIFRLLLNVFRKIVIGLFIAFLIILGINEARGMYGFSTLYRNYMDMITFVQDNPMKLPFMKDVDMTVRNANEIKAAMEYKTPEVRKFAVKASMEYFDIPQLHKKHGNIIRYFSVFKVINKNWKYIPDPVGEEYYATASESIELMAGDCDDHAILMSAAIKAIGGEPRIIHTDRHLYPEVRICHEDEFQKVIDLIKRDLFYKESLGKSIYFHRDDEGYIWLNFDYTGSYPGAPFMDRNVIGILHL